MKKLKAFLARTEWPSESGSVRGSQPWAAGRPRAPRAAPLTPSRNSGKVLAGEACGEGHCAGLQGYVGVQGDPRGPVSAVCAPLTAGAARTSLCAVTHCERGVSATAQSHPATPEASSVCGPRGGAVSKRYCCRLSDFCVAIRRRIHFQCRECRDKQRSIKEEIGECP